MVVKIQPSRLSGIVQAPASKSSMQRACALALVRNGDTLIRNPGHANDDLSALGIIQDLGAAIVMEEDNCLVRSPGFPNKRVDTNNQVYSKNSVDCGESGLAIRMFTPIISLSGEEITINGSGSLRNRPMDFFDQVLPRLGVSIQSNKGKLPLIIRGPLRPADLEIDGSLSSQFLTGLLIAFSAAHASGVTIKVNQLQSKPYIDLTLDVMRSFGMSIPENREYTAFYFSGKGLERFVKERIEYTVEGDWSGAAFLLVAGALAGGIRIKGLDVNSAQADKAILKALTLSGARLNNGVDWVETAPARLNTFSFDATDCPDLFPPLAALASYAEGISEIKGTTRLTHKESNRALTIQEEFGKLGIRVDISDNRMLIHGVGQTKMARVHSRHDHRIAMACAVAALGGNGEVEIEEAQAVNKSYPDFFKDLAALQARVSWEENTVPLS